MKLGLHQTRITVSTGHRGERGGPGGGRDALRGRAARPR